MWLLLLFPTLRNSLPAQGKASLHRRSKGLATWICRHLLIMHEFVNEQNHFQKVSVYVGAHAWVCMFIWDWLGSKWVIENTCNETRKLNNLQCPDSSGCSLFTRRLNNSKWSVEEKKIFYINCSSYYWRKIQNLSSLYHFMPPSKSLQALLLAW